MQPKQTLLFHDDFWQGFVKLSCRHQAAAVVAATALTFTPVGLLTWALATHAQGTVPDSDICNNRYLMRGFTGNSDVYGLGIRLGIYLQWLASLIANPLLERERATMAGSYLTFSLALAIAVLLLAFQHDCAFTSEIIIVLTIFWGGTLLVMVPFVQLLADIATTGLGLALIPLILSMLPVSAWFWLRLALYGELDFAATPGGTSFFLLARITSQHLQAVSWFMALLCLILCVIPVFSSICLCLVLFLDWVGQRPAEWRVDQEEKASKDKILDRLQRLMKRRAEVMKENPPQKWPMVMSGTLIASWSIIAVELTLVWNSVKGVYNVRSTGQIIALVVGLGILVKVLWLLRHGRASG
ncbi:hypothetical protein GJ744_010967 [Endocarpon pusillum]|uniref:Uncharacterized protein n=1 Tax=Endocarpon pusillum TaxID=364733 RepID=A0A8H7E1F6_9EURO|nr:hypothetical protein GJ744_010967 [Endocarpon pusillum]